MKVSFVARLFIYEIIVDISINQIFLEITLIFFI